MSQRFLTGRQRQVRFHGHYSLQHKFVLDTRFGATKHFTADIIPVFTGWSCSGQTLISTLALFRLDRLYTQSLGSGFIIDGAAATVGFLHDPSAATLVWYNADGSEQGRMVIPWEDGVIGGSSNDGGGGGPQPSDFFGGTVTDTIAWSDEGDWEFICDAEEVMQPRYDAPPHDLSTGALTNLRNASELEPQQINQAPWNGIDYYEVTRPGGLRGFIIGSRNNTSAIAARVRLDDEYWPNIKITATSVAGESALASCSALWEGGGATSAPAGASNSGSWGSASEASAHSIGANGVSSESWFPVPGRSVNTAARYAVDNPATDPMTVVWTDAFGGPLVGLTDTGAGLVTRTIGAPYRAWNMRGATGQIGSLLAQGGGSMGVRLDDASMGSTFSRIGTFCVRGHRWDQFSIQQSATRYFAKQPFPPIVGISSSSPGWKPLLGINTLSITGSGQFLRIAVGSSTGLGTGGMQLQGYNGSRDCRFISCRVRSVGSAGQPFALYFDSQKLGNDVTDADGVWKEYTFDFYAIDPVKTALATNKWYATEPPTGFTLLIFRDLAFNKTYEVEWIRGDVHNHSLLSILGDVVGMSDTLPNFRKTTLPPTGLINLMPAISTLTGAQPPGWVWNNLAPPRVGGPDVTDNFDDGVAHYYALTDFEQSDNLAAFLEGGGLNNGGGTFLEGDAKTAPLLLRGTHLASGINIYPGAGDVISGGAYGTDTPLWFGLQMRSALFGGVIGGGTPDVVLMEINPSTLADVAEAGRGAPVIDEFYRTRGPYARAVPTTFTSDPNHRAFLDPSLLTGGPTFHLGNRALRWVLWADANISHGVIAIDRTRAWLHVATDKKVRTFHLTAQVPPPLAFTSLNHPVDSWKGLSVDRRGAHLFLLGFIARTGGATHDTHKVFDSFDGGVSIREVLSMTADSAAIEIDSERGWLIDLYEAGGHIKRQISRNGGATFEAAADVVIDGAATNGSVQDLAHDSHQAGMFVGVFTIAGSTKVCQSFDAGETWKTILS